MITETREGKPFKPERMTTMKNYTAIKPTETLADFMKGLIEIIRTTTITDRDGWPITTVEKVYKDENDKIWIVRVDRDGWLYKYMED